LRVGLTGGIASGKTVVADMFADLGVAIIDTDKIARAVVEPGKPALEKIRNEFPDHVIDTSGQLDRAAMRQLVFLDENMRRKLEKILHPLIQKETVRQAEVAQGAYQILVIPLLAESPLKRFVDRVLVVDCDETTQIDRLIARDVESEDQARRILAAQASREERLAIADDVVHNDLDLDNTRRQVGILHASYLLLSQNSYSRGTD
jgi:dephospho-CoA kinase